MRSVVSMGVCLLILASLPSLGWSQDAGVVSPPAGISIAQTSDSADTLKVGEPVSLQITVSHPPDTKVEFSDEVELGRWELITHKELSSLSDENGITTELEFVFSVFRRGEATLPALTLSGSDVDAQLAELKTEPMTFKFVAGEPKQAFSPPADSVEIKVKDYTLAYAGGTLAGLALLGLLGFMAVRRRESVVVVEAPRAPHEVALEKLGTLAGENLLERGEYMVFYVRLSETTREYLGAIDGFPGTELTTREIGLRIKDHVWPKGLDTPYIIEMLKHCDFVKFSGQVPTSDEAENALRTAFTIVELTRTRATPSPQPEDEPPIEEDELARLYVEVDDNPWAPKLGEEE